MASPALAEVLRNCRWACDLSDAELARVEAGIFERSVPAGHYACRKGEPVEHWLGVIDGLLKVSSDLDSGKTMALVLVFMWVRWTFPRLRVDQMMRFEWKFLMPLAFVTLAIASCLVTAGWYFFPG